MSCFLCLLCTGVSIHIACIFYRFLWFGFFVSLWERHVVLSVGLFEKVGKSQLYSTHVSLIAPRVDDV